MLRKKKMLGGGTGTPTAEPSESVKAGATDAPNAAPPKSQSKGMAKSLEAANRLQESWVKPEADEGPLRESHHYDEIPIGQIVPDPHNARTRHILPSNPTKNALAADHPDFQENQEVIDGLVELAEQFKVTPLKQAIGVYPSKGRFMVEYGNRRYLAMKIAFGDRYKIACKVYDQKPGSPGCARFSENFSREDLSFSAKLLDFSSAMKELEADPASKTTDYRLLGISRSTFWRLNKVYRAQDVLEASLNKLILSLDEGLALIQDLPQEADRQKVYALVSKGKLSLKAAVAQVKHNKPVKARKGRVRTSIAIPPIKGRDTAVKVTKAIIDGKLKDMDWSAVDWGDLDSIQKALQVNVERLIEQVGRK